VERIFNVDKIVILTGHSEGSEGYEKLKALFTILFPECEIQIISIQPESPGNAPVDSELTTHDK
jgi:hypothetical protein